MFRLLSKVLPLVTCLVGSLTLAAEPGQPSVRALLLVPGGPVAELLPQSGEVMGSPVQVGARGLSDSFKPASRNFMLAMPDAKQESGFRTVAKVALPDQGKDFILLLEPVKASFKVHVIDGREPRFGADCVLFFNASEVNIGATLGSKKLLIRPRKTVFAKAPPRGEKPFYQVTFFEPDAGKARPFANTRWPHREGSRCYVFFYRSNAAGRLTYQAVDEDLTPLAAAE
ncbi:hypothetical protein [Haloferula sp.]|uniref:hypothetical protein n=1 Tax=Haloferula sp. TaxID=2497595 RepID=UPI003C71501F